MTGCPRPRSPHRSQPRPPPPCPSSFKSKTPANTTASTSSAAAPCAKTSDWWAKARGRPDPLLKIGDTDHGNRVGGELWALRDVSFQVREGEILGIIGRNGAGKSTLLKIQSRITAPTRGQVKMKNRK